MSWLHACYISFCTLMNYKRLCSSSKTVITNAIDTLKSTGIQKKVNCCLEVYVKLSLLNMHVIILAQLTFFINFDYCLPVREIKNVPVEENCPEVGGRYFWVQQFIQIIGD